MNTKSKKLVLFEKKNILQPTVQNLNRIKLSFMKKHNLTNEDINSIKWHEISTNVSKKSLLKDFNKLRKKYVDLLIALSIKRTNCEKCSVSIVGSEDLTSDYDATINSIKLSSKVLEYFNDIFESSWINSSSIIFDTNIYGVGFFTKVDTKQLKYNHFKHKGDLYAYLKCSKKSKKSCQIDVVNQRNWAMMQVLFNLKTYLKKKDITYFENKLRIVDYDKYEKLYYNNLEGTNPKNIIAMNKKYIERIKEIEKYKDNKKMKVTKMKDLVSSTMFFGNETYFTQGGFFHVVGLLQMGITDKQFKISKNELIDSIIENFAYLFMEYSINNSTALHFEALSAKYLSRIADAIERLKNKKEHTALKIMLVEIKKFRRLKIHSPEQKRKIRKSLKLINLKGKITKLNILKSVIKWIRKNVPEFPIDMV